MSKTGAKRGFLVTGRYRLDAKMRRSATRRLPAGETHYRVYIVSQAFVGKGRLERHRMVNALLADELAAGVHALALKTLAPGES